MRPFMTMPGVSILIRVSPKDIQSTRSMERLSMILRMIDRELIELMVGTTNSVALFFLIKLLHVNTSSPTRRDGWSTLLKTCVVSVVMLVMVVAF